MKTIIPLVSALSFAVALPAAMAQVGNAVPPAVPKVPGQPGTTAPGIDVPASRLQTPAPPGSTGGSSTSNTPGSPPPINGSTSGSGRVDGSVSGNGVRGSAQGSAGGSLQGLGDGTSRGTNGSATGTVNGGVNGGVNGNLPNTGTSRDGSNQGANGNATATGRSGTNSSADGRFDINTSSEMSMQTDLGLSASQARAVREYRDANGPFTSASQFDSIRGLDSATRARLRDRARFDDGSNGGSRTR